MRQPAASPICWWTPMGRAVVFGLAAPSIACLLADFVQGGTMRHWVCWALLPACMVLTALAMIDWRRNDGRLGRMILHGTICGLVAAIAYDLFRVPFVWARELQLDGVLPSLPLFKVFPRFGAMILGTGGEPGAYSVAEQITGWAYHFSNGATFGIMYVALVGDPQRRHWAWAVLMALGLEIGMLATPYPSVFGIRVTVAFIIVTLLAHLVFGVVLGRSAQIGGLARESHGAR